MGVIAIAMITVASTSLFDTATPSPGSKDPRIGILLVLLGCIAQGVQYVYEEKVMAVDNVPPLVVIGMEGIWGTLLTLILVYPAAKFCPGPDNGSFEDPWDSLSMIQNSSSLQLLLVSFVLTVTVYNCMAIYVTTYLSAIWHAILDNFRPITIWGFDLLIFYVLLPGQGYGETWQWTSWIQLAGLMVLFVGTAVYNGSVMVCDKEYHMIGEEDVITHDETGVMKTQLSMASPSMARSPLIYHAAPIAPTSSRTLTRSHEV